MGVTWTSPAGPAKSTGARGMAPTALRARGFPAPARHAERAIQYALEMSNRARALDTEGGGEEATRRREASPGADKENAALPMVSAADKETAAEKMATPAAHPARLPRRKARRSAARLR